MDEVNVREILNNVVRKIKASENPEYSTMTFELESAYENYSEMLTNRDENIDLTSYYTYIAKDPKKFALLISVFETFVLPKLYLEEIIKQSSQIEELSSIKLEGFKSEITDQKVNKFTINEFTSLGYLLFKNEFSLNDFIKTEPNNDN